jgi:hypothetical protein
MGKFAANILVDQKKVPEEKLTGLFVLQINL